MNLPYWSTCYHEAGHAVVAVVLRRGLVRACAWSKKQWIDGDRLSGWTVYRRHRALNRRVARDQDWAQRDLLTTLAGPVAQALACGRERGNAGDWFTANDLIDWMNYRSALSAGEAQRLLRDAKNEVRILLRGRWPAVVAVARALYRQHRLTGAQVRRIVGAVEKGPTQ